MNIGVKDSVVICHSAKESVVICHGAKGSWVIWHGAKESVVLLYVIALKRTLSSFIFFWRTRKRYITL